MASLDDPSKFTAEAVRDQLVNLAIDLYRVRASHEHYDGVDFGKIMRYSGPPGYQARDELDNLTFVPWDLDTAIPATNRHLEAGLQARIVASHHVAAACKDVVSWQIHHLLDEEIEQECMDEWENCPDTIFPRVVRFLAGPPSLIQVFDREEKMAAFQARARIPEKAKLVARWRLQNGTALPSFESFWIYVATVVDGIDTILVRKHLRKDVPIRDFLTVIEDFLSQHQHQNDDLAKKLEAGYTAIDHILKHGGMKLQQEAIKLKEGFKEIEHRQNLWEIQTSLNGNNEPAITARG